MSTGRPAVRYYVTLKGQERIVDLTEHEDGRMDVVLDGDPIDADLTPLSSSLHSLLVDGHSREMVLERDGAKVFVYLDGEKMETTVYDEVSRALSQVLDPGAGGASDICAPMPGVVVGIPVAVGDTVAVGQAVVVVEAMKMQNELAAETDGVVTEVLVAEGQTVDGGDVLVKLEAPGLVTARFHGIDHLGIAVPDLAEARRVFEELLGLPVVEEDEVPDQKVRAVKLDAGGSHLELLESTDPDGPIGRYVARRGAGIHHVTLRVEDLAGTLKELEAAGVQLIDREPRLGAGGARIAFLHPRSTAGILIELCEVAQLAG